MTYPDHVEFELCRAQKMVRKDHRQRWVTMDGTIHEKPVPYRDAISIVWVPISDVVVYAFRPKVNPHSAIGAS